MKNPLSNLINRFSGYFEKNSEKKQRVQQKTDSLINEYQDLIDEYRLIQEKKSKLSRSKRDFIEHRIKFLISKGHLKINTQQND